MNRFPDAAATAMLTHDDYEPAAEWLGGEAWVNPVALAPYACEALRDPRIEPAAADWIPV